MIHYARNSRLEFSINKSQARFKARKSFHSLINRGFLRLEENINLINYKRYKAQNKVLFTSNYTRFYFYFLKPLERMILKDKERAFALICDEFDKYLSFIYELVAISWVKQRFGVERVQSVWGKDFECDIYYQGEICLLGEVKFKGKKMCLSDYSKLKNTAKFLGLHPDFYILFSKNGFSKKLINLNDTKLILANHLDF